MPEPVELVKDPETGLLVLPTDKSTSSPDSPARKALRLTPMPDTSNPETYTAAIQLGDLVVLAVDDFDEETFEALLAEEGELIARRDEAERLAASHRAALVACTNSEEAVALRDSLNASNNDYDTAQSGLLALWRRVSDKHVKGLRHDDGLFYAFADGERSPIRTAPAYKAVVFALSRRASLGASEADFLPQR